MATKPRPPIMPANPKDPTGVDSVERAAMLSFTRRLNQISRYYVELLGRIPAEPVATANELVANAKYTFQLDPFMLNTLMSDASLLVDTVLLEGGENNLWFFEQYVEVGYKRGTAQAFANLANQSPVYRSGRGSATEILSSPPYQRRLALARARIFEEMKGLSAQVKTDMSRVLTEGIGRGLNPKTIGKMLNEQAGIEARRGHRIARTEVPMALRRATLDEDAQARADYNLNTGMIHLSALSGTTRASHAARHGNIYTEDQIRDWYAVNGNAINCKCAQRSVLLGEDGKPVVPGIEKRAKTSKKAFEEKEKFAANAQHIVCVIPNVVTIRN